MGKHKAKHKDRGLVNTMPKTQSTLTLTDIDFNLTDWDVKGNVTDDSPKTTGVWKAKRLMNGDVEKELRLLLTCVTQPEKTVKAPPDAGTLTITLTKGGSDEMVTPIVDYANDAPPPP
jgi:hypothetical protein